jgi:hypothetical protein
MSVVANQPRPAVVTPTRIELLHPKVVEILRKKTPTERVAMIFEANRSLHRRLAAHLRQEHPDWSDAEVQQEIARRRLRGAG